MRVVFMGTPDFAVPALEALANIHDVVMVVTQEDKRRGRGKKLQPTVVKKSAQELGLPTMTPKNVNDPLTVEILEKLKPDIIVVVAYGQIIKPAILHIPHYGCLNIHGSILPKYRGAAPLQRAIMAGEETMGVAIMKMEEGLDTGPVALTKTTDAGHKTMGELHDELAKLGAEAIIDVLASVENGTVQWVKQDDSQATYAHKIEKSDGLLDFHQTAKTVYQRTLAMDPYPGAYTYLHGEVMKLFSPQLEEKKTEQTPGHVVSISDAGLSVACQDGIVTFKALQLQGKKRMAVEDYLRGNNFPQDVILGG